MSPVGHAIGEGRTDAAASAAAPSPLPCRNRNNCIQPGPKYRLKRTETEGVKVDREGRYWVEETEGVHRILDYSEIKTGADRKRAFILRKHVDAFVSHWQRNHTLFFTTTDGEGLTPKHYAKCWHSLTTNESDWILAFLRVLEPQKNGRPHFHNLTAVEFDTKPDAFDWDAFTAAQEAYRAKDWAKFRVMRARYVASAAPELRELWAWGRRVMPRYGLGRCEILPIRKEGAISEYIGKYLDKGMALKIDSWKGVRRFETDRRTSQDWKRCGSKFSWVSPGAAMWRERVGQVAFAIGADTESGDIAQISAKLGPRWAYRLRGAIVTATAEEWTETMYALGATVGRLKREITIEAA